MALTHDSGRRLDLDWDTADPARAPHRRRPVVLWPRWPATATTTPATSSAPSGCWAAASTSTGAASSRCGTPTASGSTATPTTTRPRSSPRCRRSGEARVRLPPLAGGRSWPTPPRAPVSIYEHDEAGRLVALVDAEGHRLVRRFDDAGRCLEATGFGGDITHQRTEADGRVATGPAPTGSASGGSTTTPTG